MKTEAKILGWLCAGALACAAHAGPEWEEPMGALDDAGSDPMSAQVPKGDGALTALRGELSGPFPRQAPRGVPMLDDFQDVFVIFIEAPGQFLATTDSAQFGDAAFDSSLFLFYLDGEGLLGNNESPNAMPPDRAELPNQSNDGTNVQLTRRGLYLLAIAGTGNVPVGVDPLGPRQIFQFTDPFEVSGPDGQGGANNLPLVEWLGPVMMGGYDIRLEGVTFPPLCPGDVNGDGVTNTQDITFVVSNLGAIGRRGLVQGDADLDGQTTVADVTFVVSNLGCDAQQFLAGSGPNGGSRSGGGETELTR